jgi:hypothetical protein
MDEETKRQRASYQLIQCRSCGSAVVETLSRCPYCGRRIAGHEQKVTEADVKQQKKDQQQQQRKTTSQKRWIECEECGRKIPAYARVCRFCGHRMEIVKGVQVVIAALSLILLFAVLARWVF